VPAGQTWRGAPARPIKEQMEMEAHMQQLPQFVKRLKVLEEKKGGKAGLVTKEKKK